MTNVTFFQIKPTCYPVLLSEVILITKNTELKDKFKKKKSIKNDKIKQCQRTGEKQLPPS